MITVIAWILLSVVSVILILALAVLFWKPKQAQTEKETTTENRNLQSDENNEENKLRIRRYLQEMRIRWKDLGLMLEKTELNDVLLFHWKGLHGKKKVLFNVTEAEAGESLFEAVSDLNHVSLIPDLDFYISIPLTDDREKISLELCRWMQQKKIHLDFVLENSDGLYDLPGLDGIQAVIGIGKKASVLYEVKGDSAEADWMASLHSELPLTPKWNEQAERMFSAIRKKLPWQIRLEHRLPLAFHNKAMKDLMALMPVCGEWFLPEIDRRGKKLYVSANDAEILRIAEKEIETSAQKNQIHLRRISEHRVRLSADVQDENYRIISEACRKSIETSAVIPVLMNHLENDSDFTPTETIFFAPLMSGKRISSSGSLSFYKNVLRKGL